MASTTLAATSPRETLNTAPNHDRPCKCGIKAIAEMSICKALREDVQEVVSFSFPLPLADHLMSPIS